MRSASQRSPRYPGRHAGWKIPQMGSAIRSYLPPDRGTAATCRHLAALLGQDPRIDHGPAAPAWLPHVGSSREAKHGTWRCGRFCSSAIEARGAGSSKAGWAGPVAGVDTCPSPTPASSSKVRVQAAVTFLLKLPVTGELRRVLGAFRTPSLYCLCLAGTAASSLDKTRGPSFCVHPVMCSHNPDKQGHQFLPLLNGLI